MIKRGFKFLFTDRVELMIILFSIIPLFFNSYMYPDFVYLLLFSYFAVDFIRRYRLGEYHKSKAALFTDILGLISFIEVFHILILCRLFRVIKLLYKVKGVWFIIKIYKKHIEALKNLIYVSLGFMLLSSLILYNIEPQTFDYNYLNAFYWSGITLTTVGYGDIYPVTMLGKFIGMFISFIGIGIIALPTGFIASEFMSEMNKERNKHEHHSKHNKYKERK